MLRGVQSASSLSVHSIAAWYNYRHTDHLQQPCTGGGSGKELVAKKPLYLQLSPEMQHTKVKCSLGQVVLLHYKARQMRPLNYSRQTESSQGPVWVNQEEENLTDIVHPLFTHKRFYGFTHKKLAKLPDITYSHGLQNQ